MDKIKIERLTEEQKKALNIPESPKRQGPWTVWECAPSEFHWHYDQLEKAYLFEGKVKVKTPTQEVDLVAGDFVVFPKGLSCSWQVLEKVRKVYMFQ